ncbi:Pyruvate synthase subunit PorA [uncultured archaeon]|nr:Pyruvate synthase subunit PorA [uncultured archaeon]
MIKTKEGTKAIAEMVVNCKPEVVACYPITPTTGVATELNQYYADGLLKEYITVEAEFSAISSLVGASAAGARTFTVTGGQGLLYMHEVIVSIPGMRLPIVIVNGNRAVSSPLNIWNDEQDSILQRDAGWIQLYCKSIQEAVDSVPQAFYIAEKAMLPVMICIDGHYLTHAVEQVDVADAKAVDEFLPAFRPAMKLDPENPVSLGVYANPSYYQDFREDLVKDLEGSKKIIVEAGKKWGKLTGREYGLVHGHMAKDAERVIVGLGSAMDNAIAVVNELRRKGEKVGALHIRSFRPFPREEIRAMLAGKKVGVIDRALSVGSQAPLYIEVQEALAGTNAEVSSFYGGLGGRGIKRVLVADLFEKLKKGPSKGWIASSGKELPLK